MPGLIKTFKDVIIELFCLCYPSSSCHFEILLSVSTYFSYVDALIIRLTQISDNENSSFNVIASDMINFCNNEIKEYVSSIEVSENEKKISLIFHDNFEDEFKMLLSDFSCKHP